MQCHLRHSHRLKDEKVMAQMKGCTKRYQCEVNQKVMRLCVEHAKSCQEIKCPMSSFSALKDKLKQRQVTTVSAPLTVSQALASSESIISTPDSSMTVPHAVVRMSHHVMSRTSTSSAKANPVMFALINSSSEQ